MWASTPGPGRRPNPAACPAPTAYNWSGLYIGLNAGYAAAKVTETVTGGGSGSANIPAGLGGLQIGANVQTGAIVWGFEGDFDGNMATKSVAVAGGALSGTAQIPWLATLRGRVGYAFDHYLLYVTAGGAATELKSAVTVGAISSATTSSTAGAWTAGGGFEAAFAENLAPGSNTFISTPAISTWRRSARHSLRSPAGCKTIWCGPA